MKKQLRDEWVKALRSGEFKQGTGRLQDGDAYCCLGVLCLVAERIGFAPAVRRPFDGAEELQGMYLGAQNLGNQISSAIERETSTMNDAGVLFPEIATWIEANVPVSE